MEINDTMIEIIVKPNKKISSEEGLSGLNKSISNWTLTELNEQEIKF